MNFSLNNLRVGYRKKEICRVDNKTWQKGGLIGVAGLNGSGKTTFFKTLMGLLTPLEGRVLLDNMDLSRLRVQERAKRITFVQSKLAQLPSISVRQMLELGRLAYHPLLFKLSSTEKQQVEAWAECFGIHEWLEKDCRALSDGELQKVSLARAWIQDTKIVLLDEPTAHLDWKNKETILELLEGLVAPGDKLVFMASHDLASLTRSCTSHGYVSEKQLKWLDKEEFNQIIP